jgi:hypothetical protein
MKRKTDPRFDTKTGKTVVSVNDNPPFIVRIKNVTDEKLYNVPLFSVQEVKNDKIRYESVPENIDYEMIIAHFQNSNDEILSSVIIQAFCGYSKFTEKQLNQRFLTEVSEQSGRKTFVPTIMMIHPDQHQQNIIGIPNLHLPIGKQKDDAFANIIFDYLMPETEMIINLYLKRK